MESVVNRIIEIDRNADERISAVTEKEKQILNDAETECTAIKKKLLYSAQEQINQIEAFNRTEFEKDSAELEKKHREEISSLDDFYNANHKIIEDKIFAEIVGE